MNIVEKNEKKFERPHKVDGEGAGGIKIELASISSAYI